MDAKTLLGKHLDNSPLSPDEITQIRQDLSDVLGTQVRQEDLGVYVGQNRGELSALENGRKPPQPHFNVLMRLIHQVVVGRRRKRKA